MDSKKPAEVAKTTRAPHTRHEAKSSKPRLPEGARARTRAQAKNEAHDDALAAYIAAIGQVPLLSAEEESRAAMAIQDIEEKCWVHLLQRKACVDFLRVEACTNGQDELEKLCSTLSARAQPAQRQQVAAHLRVLDEDKALLGRLLRHCEKSMSGERKQAFVATAFALRKEAERRRNDFVTSNLRLVVSVAKKFHHHRLSLNDLIQEGNIGLLKSVQRFDPHKGFRFSTYAHWWIRQAIERSIMNKGCQIRLPVHVYEQRRELAKAKHELEQSFGREPSLRELSNALGMSAVRVDELMRTVPSEPQSLDEPFADDEGRTLMETLTDPRYVSIDVMVSCVDDARSIRDAMDELTPMERDIINRRFGLHLGEDETLEEIGKSYRLSRERVRQIQVKGLRKIADYCAEPGEATA